MRPGARPGHNRRITRLLILWQVWQICIVPEGRGVVSDIHWMGTKGRAGQDVELVWPAEAHRCYRTPGVSNLDKRVI